MSELQSNSTAIAGSSPVPGSGFRPGDVAYIASWNYGRRLILSINGDIAECLDLQGHECRHSLRGLQTLSEWINTSRRLAEDCDMKMSEVNAYIKAMSAPYETPPQWVAALKDIQNVTEQQPAPTKTDDN